MIVGAAAIVAAVTTTTAFAGWDATIRPCTWGDDSDPEATFPPPPPPPHHDLPDGPIPKPRVIAQELHVQPGVELLKLERRVAVEVPCGSPWVSRVTFDDGTTFLLEPGVRSVEPRDGENGDFIAWFVKPGARRSLNPH